MIGTLTNVMQPVVTGNTNEFQYHWKSIVKAIFGSLGVPGYGTAEIIVGFLFYSAKEKMSETFREQINGCGEKTWPGRRTLSFAVFGIFNSLRFKFKT